MSSPPLDAAERLTQLQEVTGNRNEVECRQALEANNWDLNEAASLLLALSGESQREAQGGSGSGGGGLGGGGGRVGEPLLSSHPLNSSSSPAGLAHGSFSNLRSRAGTAAVAASGANGFGSGVGGGRDGRGAAAGEGGSGGAAGLGLNHLDSPPSGHPPSVPDSDLLLPPSDRFPHSSSLRSMRPGVGGSSSSSSSRPSFLARILSFPFWALRGTVGAVAGAVALSIWAAGSAFSFLLARLGSAVFWAANSIVPLHPSSSASAHRRAVTLPEAAVFRQRFEAEYSTLHPEFFPGSFKEALRRAGEQFRFLLVYLHAPEHVDTPGFCRATLCSPDLVQFVDDNFVLWGGDLRGSEGYQMSTRLRATTYPFCAVLTSAGGNRVTLLRSIEGPLGVSQLVEVLLRVLEEQGAMLVAARAEEEERAYNRRLREEQDAAYQAGLLADQAKERERQEEERRRQEEEERERRSEREEQERVAEANRAAAAAQAEIERRRQEAAARLLEQPEKGPDVTQVLIRMPGGERRERRFPSVAPVQALYDYVDAEALGTLLPSCHYSLVSNFPRKVYDHATRGLSLKDAGLHPHAGLFVQLDEGNADGDALKGEDKA